MMDFAELSRRNRLNAKIIPKLHKQGLNATQISKIMKISRQRAWVLLKKHINMVDKKQFKKNKG